ncbi:MAG: hypothetical protein ACRYFX_12770 [Janthinobacterium lividum]
MKINEVIPRQNRIVYTLLIIVGALGLVWGIWSRMHAEDEPAPAAPVVQASGK